MTEKIFLLADDDSDETDLFLEALAAVNGSITCHSCRNGQEAINKIDKLDEKPHLIFLDINMPIMNGWQCLKYLKSHHVYKHIPVIIYSTSSHQRDKEIATDLGALCFFTKPNNFNELKKALKIIFEETNISLANPAEQFNNIKLEGLTYLK